MAMLKTFNNSKIQTGGLLDWDLIAVFIATILTFINGVISFYRGINEFIQDGGSIIPGLDPIETSVGTIIIFLSINMVALLFTTMKVYLCSILTKIRIQR
jgi:hypothetical protein